MNLSKSPSHVLGKNISMIQGGSEGQDDSLILPSLDLNVELPPGQNFERQSIQRNSLSSLLKLAEQDEHLNSV